MAERVYVETSIVSYLAAKPSRDVVILGRQAATRDWWSEERGRYHVFTSVAVLEEASRGDAGAAERRTEYLRALELLEVTEEAVELAEILMKRSAVPAQAEIDALHIATATVHGMDLLLTWNFKHIANPHQWRAIGAICRGAGFDPPVACSPDQLLLASTEREST